jgi:outer membrane biosynthesis protein TonB
MGLEDATEFGTVAYQAAATPPRIKLRPPLVVPDEVREAKLQGKVDVVLTIGADGAVLDAALVAGFHPAADAGCLTYVRSTRWKPGLMGEQAVTVKGVPFTCRYEMSAE